MNWIKTASMSLLFGEPGGKLEEGNQQQEEQKENPVPDPQPLYQQVDSLLPSFLDHKQPQQEGTTEVARTDSVLDQRPRVTKTVSRTYDLRRTPQRQKLSNGESVYKDSQ